MILALEAFSAYIVRWADAAARRAGPMTWRRSPVTWRPRRRAPSARRSQLVAFTHLAFESEGRYAMALGRLDQYLLPFYRRRRGDVGPVG
jgi:hypothetical protein